ncbi:MAG: LPS-assembly protein LptD [Bacteroidales bacterium]|nr:LPS-assembly protein LptD [Bacteroidales bacterium]
MRNKSIHILFFLFALLMLGGADAYAQRRGDRKPLAGGARPHKEAAPPDSLELARRDSLHRADSLFKVDSLNMLQMSSLTQPAFSEARDSIVEVFTDGSRKIYYYGDVTVKYQDITLKAERMEYDLNTGICYAHGVLDTLTGEWVGRPVMTQGGKTYNMAEVKYNFNNRKANIKQVITSEDDGLLHGDHVKMMPDKSINVDHGKYTVCDLEHPHYWMELSVAKVVTKPTRKTVFGPAHLVIADVHLPFVGIPFGFIPKRPERATGLLMPTFGEETARGFYMRDGGMYFVFGDYLDLSVTGDYYTLGSWALDVNSRYKINYKANGSFSLTLSHDQVGEQGSPDFSSSGNFGVRWTHSQDSKAHPGTSFSASVNFSSPKNSKYNSHSVNEALQNQISSSISYAHNWGGKVNLSINALHSQNSRDSSYAFTLPNISLSVSTFYPFKKKNRVGKEKPWEKISFGYNTSLQNKINFKASEFKEEFGTPAFTDRFKNGMNHNFSIGLPSFQLLKYLNFNPSVSYGQSWFFRASEAEYDPETNKVSLVQGDAFRHFGITQTYSGSVSMSTRLYGMFNFGRYSKVQAIRHVISPSVSMSFSPEKGTYANGWRTYTYTDKNGEAKEYDYNIYQGQLGSYPSKGKSATANISIGNNLEAKVRDPADSTGKGSKKVKLLDQLNFSTSYNFLADSLKMNKISASMSTNLFGKVNISASAGFDPYAVQLVNGSARRINTFAVNAGQGLVRFTNASASASYSISGKGTINGNDGREDSSSPASFYQRIYYHPVTGEYVPGGWLYYTNPNVPWSMNFNTSLNCNVTDKYDKELNALVKDTKYTATLGMSGNIKLTPRMSINASSGYDFIAKKITTTQISATYDLHCFNIAVSWVPLGTWQSYSFKIAANAASLADLLRFKKSSSYWDN